MSNQEEAKKYFLEGIKYYSDKNYDNAILKFEKSLALFPDRPSILLNLSKSYFQIKNYEKAELQLWKLVSLNGLENEKKEALNILLKIYFKTDDLGGINKIRNIFEYEKYFDDYTNIKIHFFYPKIFDSEKEIKIERNRYEKNILKLLNYSNLPKLDLIKNPFIPPNFSLSYDGNDNLEINKNLIKLYKRIYPKLNVKTNYNRNKNKKIKIGFISEFFTNHTILKLFEGLIYNLDKTEFEIYVFYSDKTLPGSRYDQIKRNSILYNYENIFLPEIFEEKVIEIKKHALDILFYTDIHMSETLYFLTLLRLAKYQITSWGHPETTGNSEIDFFLSSELLETENCNENYTEKVLLSKYLPMYFYKPIVINKLSDDLLISKNIYTCPQNLIKMHPNFDIAIKKILEKDKKAKIFFIKDKNENITKKFFNRLKKSLSINIDRINFLDKFTVEEYINHCGKSSVILDPFFFGAGNSFHESMFYGTPTVSMPTKYLKSRIVYGAYKQMKIENPPISYDMNEYVDLCVENANNISIELKKYYQTQADRNLFENINAVRDIEQIFKNIVNK